MPSNKTPASKFIVRAAAVSMALFMIAMPVSAQLGAPPVPGVPAVPGAGVPGVPGAPGVPGVPAVPGAPGVPAVPGAPGVPVTAEPHASGAVVCADGTEAHALTSGHAAEARRQVEGAASPVTDQLPLVTPQAPGTPDVGLSHCVDVDAEDPEGTAADAQGKATGFVGTLQSWAQSLIGALPF